MHRQHFVAVVLVALTASLPAQQFARASREAIPGSGPSHVRSSLVDLDGDGALDVFSRVTHWSRNDGRGRFTDVPLTPLANQDSQLVAGDFDGDGDRDVLVDGAVLENRGAAGPAFVPATVNVLALASGRLDGDARDDFVYGGGVALATSLTTFTFQSIAPIGAMDAAIADLDGDGDRDIVWAVSPVVIPPSPWWPLPQTFPGHERVSFNQGNGTFVTSAPFVNALDDYTGEVVVLDADGDGLVDCACRGATSWQFWRNQGGGVFATWNGPVLAPTPLEAHDLDRDGDTDLVARDRWYENAGGGAFVEHAIVVNGGALHAIGDVDGDLDLDLLHGRVGSEPSAHRLLLNQGNEDFVDATATPWSATPLLSSLTWLCGDIDGDGDPDLHESRATWWRNPGDAWLEYGGLPLPPSNTLDDLLVDLDADGDLDVLRGSQVAINTGGTFVAGVVTGATPAAARLAFDADGDGRADLLDEHPSNGHRILVNQGGLSFAALSSVAFGTIPIAIVAADFDGDGDQDLLVGSGVSGGSRARLFRNGGSGVFAWDPAGVVMPSGAVTRFAVGDVDGDGDLDVLVGRKWISSSTHLLLRNTGGVLIVDPAALPVHAGGAAVALGDLDADGDLDAVVTIAVSASTTDLAAWTNDGTGTFAHAEDLGMGEGQIGLFDFDFDGDADLLAQQRLLLNRHWHCEAPFLPQTGTVYTLRVGGRALPNAWALPWFGTRAQIVLPGIGTLGVDPLTAMPLAPFVLAGEMGALSFAIPSNPVLVGMPFSMQALLFDGTTLHATPPKHEVVRS